MTAYHIRLYWTLLPVCCTAGDDTAAACCLLLNLHTKKNCTALLLLLLHVLYAVLLRLAICRWTAAAAACSCCKCMHEYVGPVVSAIERPEARFRYGFEPSSR